MILVATMTPDYSSSSTAALIQHQIGATRAAAVDIQAACSGFIYALSIAKAYIESGLYRNVLVVAAEKMSSIVDYSDRNTCVLFGDGAAACVVSRQGAGQIIGSLHLGANGAMANLLYVPAGGSRKPTTAGTVAAGEHYIKMQGKELFKHAVRQMTFAAKECLNSANISEIHLKWLVPHQANERIIDALIKAFEIAPSKVYKTVHKYSNTSASSIPIALSELLTAHPLETGDNVLLLAFGAGLTYGALLLTQS
jgi:3-oxoacyl-[acyl-carrier-protein] synthase-3